MLRITEKSTKQQVLRACKNGMGWQLKDAI